jgi:ankyrin repeat protein
MPPKKAPKKAETKQEATEREIRTTCQNLNTLHRCAELNDLVALRGLITSEPKLIDELDTEGRTAVAVACRAGNLPALKCLVEGKANVDAQSFGGRSALFFACIEGHLPVVEYLLNELKVNAADKDASGNTPFHAACRQGHVKVVEAMELNQSVDINCRNEFKRTPLMAATMTSQLPLIDHLVKCRADVGAVDSDGVSALHIAARCGFWRAVNKLLALNADPNQKSQSGKTPLQLCAEGSAVFKVLDKVTAKS